MPPLLLASITSVTAVSKPPDSAIRRLASTPAPLEQLSRQPDEIVELKAQPHSVSPPESLASGAAIGPDPLAVQPTQSGLPDASSASAPIGVELKQHVVQPGETIWEIAQRHNLSSQAILDANPGVKPKRLHINQILTLPLSKSADRALAPGEFMQHVVGSGETIWEIAQHYNLSSQAILDANPSIAPKRLQVDQTLSIPIPQAANVEPTAAAVATPELPSQPTFTPPVTGPAASHPPTASAPERVDARVNRLDWIAGHAQALGVSAALGVAAVGVFWYWRRAFAYGDASSVMLAPAPPTSFQPGSAKESASGAAVTELANWSTFVQTVLDQPPSTLPSRWLSGGMAFCLVFGAWAWIGQIEEIGHAQGQLAPKGDVYKVQFIDLGKVIDIAVEEGQQVKAGQVLVELDTQAAASEVARLQQMLATLQIELDQKRTLIAKTRLEAKSRAAIAQADHQAQVVAIAQAEARAHTTQMLITQLEGDAAAHQSRLERLEPLLEAGAISREEVFGAEQTLRERQRAITQRLGERRQALAETERLQAGLAQKQAEGQRAQLEAQQQIQQLEADVTQVSAKIDETANLLNQAQLELERRYLYAPVNGVILSLEVSNVGEVVEPGQTIAEIAPVDAPLVLSAKLPNQEAGFVEAGMAVQVKFDAYPYQDYGVVSGRVTAISPDAEMDERLGKVYEVEIALDRDHVATPDQLIRFKPGQTASADIVIRQRRIADVLLDPIRQLQQDGISL